MRPLLVFLLSLILSINAAGAAVIDICDVTEHFPAHGGAAAAGDHASHFGHHEHDHQHPLAEPEGSGDAGSDSAVPHDCHSHAHPCFSTVLPEKAVLPASTSSEPGAFGPVDRLMSTSHSRLERPPRATLA